MNTKYLRFFSIGYLLLSNLLFLSKWFHIRYSLFFIIGNLVFFALYSKKFKGASETHIPYKSLFSTALIALLWTLLMGVGGVFQQTMDYVGHHAKLFELYDQEWPIEISERGSFSCYYYGYYFVPAFIFKLTGSISDTIMVLYSWFGVWMGLLWLYLIVNRNMSILFSVLLVGGGMSTLELFSLSVFRTSISPVPLFSLFVNSLFVVNQIAPTLICLGLILFYKRDYKMSFYPLTLSFIWGVFPAFIMILFSGIDWCLGLITRSIRTSIKEIIIHYVIPSLLFLPVFIYLTSSDELPVHGFYRFNTPLAILPFMDCIIFGLISFWLIKFEKNPENAVSVSTMIIALLMLAALGTYRLGIYNDLYLRGSMPLLLIVLIGIFQRLAFSIRSYYPGTETEHHGTGKYAGLWKQKGKYALIMVWLVLGSVSSLHQLKILLQSNRIIGNYDPFPYDDYKSSYHALRAHYGEDGADQYIGNPDSFYYKYLLPEKK